MRISNSILDELNKNKESLTESVDNSYNNTEEKFCPRCGKTYTDFPAWSRYDDETYICPDCGVEEAIINAYGQSVDDPHKFTQETKKEATNEEVSVDTQEDKEDKEERAAELKVAIEDGALSPDEKARAEEEIKELESDLNESAEVLTEAPEDEFPEEETPVEDIPVDEPIEEPTEEMTDTEIQDEIQDDEEEKIEDEVEQPFYATMEELDELRDILPDLDYRLFLINDNMVCIGRLNGADIEFLTSNHPNRDVEIDKSEQNKEADEVEERAENQEEDSFEYLWIKAPESLDQFLSQVNVVYLSPDMSDEDKEQYAGIEASHESVVNYLMNQLPEERREELEKEEFEDEAGFSADIPEEPEESTEEFPELEEPIEENPEDEEEVK